MSDTMVQYEGIGLAAIQVGVPKRILLANPGKPRSAKVEAAREPVEGDDAPKPRAKRPIGDLPTPDGEIVMINPEILDASDEMNECNEGCLSIPEMYEDVVRPARIRVAYHDLTGARHELEADGLFATVIQHELDHLNGVLFIDHISRLKRERIVRKFVKLARQERKDSEKDGSSVVSSLLANS